MVDPWTTTAPSGPTAVESTPAAPPNNMSFRRRTESDKFLSQATGIADAIEAA
jgi:hypothetical protein